MSFEQVRATLRAERDLAHLEPSNLSSTLAHLARQGRVLAVIRRRAGGAGRRRNYYTLPGLERVVPRGELKAPDAVLDIARELSRRSEGRPFTTSALRRFGAPRLPAGGSRPRTFWSNAVLALEARGDLRRVRVLRHGASVRVWWTVTGARDSRETHLEGEASAPSTLAVCVPERLLSHRGPDVDFVSRASDCRTLALAAKARAARGAVGAEERAALHERPVEFEQLWAVRSDCPGLGPRTRRGLADALHAMARSPGDAKPGDLVRLASGDGSVWYDLVPEAPGADGIPRRGADGAARIVSLYGALEAAAQPWLARACRDFLRDRLLVDAVLPGILAARMTCLALELDARMRALDQASSGLVLLAVERRRVVDLLARLVSFKSQLLGEVPTEPPVHAPAPVPGSDFLLDLDDAYRQLEELRVISLSSPRALTSRLKTVRVVRMPVSAQNPRGRVFFDRVDFACYCLGAYAPGDSPLAPWVRRGRTVLGALREPGPLIEAFAEMAPGAALGSRMAGVVAALGLLDDPPSRGAVVRFLDEAVTAILPTDTRRPEGILPPATAAMESALIALARRPLGGLASELRPREEAVLGAFERAATLRGWSRLAAIARKARSSWVTGARSPEWMTG